MNIWLIEMPGVIPVRYELLDKVGDEHLMLLCKDGQVWALFSPFEPSGLLPSASARKKKTSEEGDVVHAYDATPNKRLLRLEHKHGIIDAQLYQVISYLEAHPFFIPFL